MQLCIFATFQRFHVVCYPNIQETMKLVDSTESKVTAGTSIKVNRIEPLRMPAPLETPVPNNTSVSTTSEQLSLNPGFN